MVIGLNGVQFGLLYRRSGNPICLSRVWLQTELEDTKSYFQLIIKITISEKRMANLWKKRKINIKKKTGKGDVNILRPPRLLLNWAPKTQKQARVRTFVTTTLNVIDLLNCLVTNCPITNCNSLASELVKSRSFLSQSQSRKLSNFFD